MANHQSSSNESSSSDDLSIVVFEKYEADSTRLAELETQIQRLRTQIQRDGAAIGLALLEIHDKGLYRETHRTFAAYLKERWGYSRSHSYRLINHAIDIQMSPVLNANLSPLLGRCDYSAVYLYNMMQSRVYRWKKQSDWIKVL